MVVVVVAGFGGPGEEVGGDCGVREGGKRGREGVRGERREGDVAGFSEEEELAGCDYAIDVADGE